MGFHAKRRLGQNFLVNRAIVSRIVDALKPQPGDAVLEIGPGHGALTAPLIDAVGRIAAVELDPQLGEQLQRKHGERLLLYHSDVLKLQFAEVRRALGTEASARLLVVGNLPYNVSKPVAMKLVEERTEVERAVLMFQREVAQRLTAKPGVRAYAPLTVLTSQAYTVRALFEVSPAAFRPRPKVVSSVTEWASVPTTPSDVVLSDLRRLLAVCFRSRRRTLRNNLRAALGDDVRAGQLLASAEIDGDRRAETLDPTEFVRLSERWRSMESDR
jgi:16S rRNA (adenine1518-N6/adenine1519-N6)-dimethyltransferase